MYLWGIAPSTTCDDIKSGLAQFGPVVKCSRPEGEDGRPLPYAFVSFKRARDARNALRVGSVWVKGYVWKIKSITRKADVFSDLESF